MITIKRVKPKLKYAVNTFKAEGFLEDSNYTIINQSIKFPLRIGPKFTLDENNPPKMFKLVADFCAEHN